MTLDGPGSSSMGYIDIAKSNGGTWFETPDSFWPQLREGFVNSGVDPKSAMRMADVTPIKRQDPKLPGTLVLTEQLTS